MPEGKVATILTIEVKCPTCGEYCDNERGSSMISPDDKVLFCEGCAQECSPPKNAFLVPRDQTERNSRS